MSHNRERKRVVMGSDRSLQTMSREYAIVVVAVGVQPFSVVFLQQVVINNFCCLQFGPHARASIVLFLDSKPVLGCSRLLSL